MMMMMAQCATFLNVSPNHGDPTAYITIMMCFIWYFGLSKSEEKNLAAAARSPIPLVGREGTLSPYLPSTLLVSRFRRPSPLNPNSGDAIECPYI